VREGADARRGHEDPVAFPAVDDLGIAGDNPDAHRVRGLTHRSRDALEVVQGEAFLQDEGGRQVQGTRATHREVVHRPVDGQAADVAPREEEGAHDVAIRGEREARLFYGKNGAVVTGLQQRIPEGRKEDRLDEVSHHAPPAPVGELDARVAHARCRTGQREAHGHSPCRTAGCRR
jgi:hypothetical protein